MTGFADPDDPDTIRIPFIFVPHGDPVPTEWLRDHPEAFRVPARIVWREGEDGGQTAAIALDLKSTHQQASFDGSSPSDRADNTILLAQARTLLQRGLPPSPPVRLAPNPAPPPTPAPSEPGWADWSIHTFLHLLLPGLPPLWPGDRSGLGVLEANPKPDRNAGLPAPLRAYTYRARKSAEEADAATNEVLDPEERRAHHLINAGATGGFGDLLSAAARTGWFMDEPANVITLPANEAAQAKLAAKGIFLPYHDNPHPRWNRGVQAGLMLIRTNAEATFGKQGSEAKDLFVRLQMETLQESLRSDIPGLSRVVEIGPAPLTSNGSG